MSLSPPSSPPLKGWLEQQLLQHKQNPSLQKAVLLSTTDFLSW